MNLLARRAQIELAKDGAELLRGKREALLKELIARAKELKALREELHRRGRVAVTAVALSKAVNGTAALESAAMAGNRHISVRIKKDAIWGIPLVSLDAQDIIRQPNERGAGTLDHPAHVFEAAEETEEMLEQLLRCAPAEANLQRLGTEVKRVSRRINALEERLLPRLREDVRQIERVLDEREREDRFRLKRVKAKKAQAGAGPEA